jgi:hypothetical protein
LLSHPIRLHRKKGKILRKHLAHFLSLKDMVQQHHVSHTNHHRHTIKTPHQSPAFSQNPLQKPRSAMAQKKIEKIPT